MHKNHYTKKHQQRSTWQRTGDISGLLTSMTFISNIHVCVRFPPCKRTKLQTSAETRQVDLVHKVPQTEECMECAFLEFYFLISGTGKSDSMQTDSFQCFSQNRTWFNELPKVIESKNMLSSAVCAVLLSICSLKQCMCVHKIKQRNYFPQSQISKR